MSARKKHGQPGPVVNSYAFDNWNNDATPPLQINDAASLHSLIAWCWGEAADIEAIADLLATDEAIAFGTSTLLVNKVGPLVRMLEELGTRTSKMGADRG